ncbi:HlyU family transcriptional regulator [Shinella zoogloeoides]|uniref:HlyU family transcriptional regulator n=1 Tax=Shinella zoogloeoides TaxID=352475 RepID=UPI00273E8C41|nr:HlyU family transcriptional regulator [Shinella zoogloeoides]WLR94091.1 HlyU family transcriptional regulator [Shinella zoogloeoides]
MASFFSKLFGRGGDSAAPAKIAEETEAYNDLTLVAAPIPEGGQYRLAGRIEKRDGERVLVRTFIRADLFSSRDDTVASTFRKARQIADQHGASLFSDGAESRQV